MRICNHNDGRAHLKLVPFMQVLQGEPQRAPRADANTPCRYPSCYLDVTAPKGPRHCTRSHVRHQDVHKARSHDCRSAHAMTTIGRRGRAHMSFCVPSRARARRIGRLELRELASQYAVDDRVLQRVRGVLVPLALLCGLGLAQRAHPDVAPPILAGRPPGWIPCQSVVGAVARK